MRSAFVATLLLACTAVSARSHPGVGIVLDGTGSVYYTDLTHVWRIAPDGSRTIAVRDVHTHELFMDREGNLYGEDSEYLGNDRFRTRVWRRSTDGRITVVAPWRDGTYPEFGYTRDGTGAMYWVSCSAGRCAIRRGSSDGRTSTVVAAERLNHHPINWLAATHTGHLYVVDGPDLRLFRRDGRAVTVAPRLESSLMGMWVDQPGNSVYVAAFGTRSVVRVDSAGRVTTVARTPAPWAPAGVTRAPDGTLWLLEWSPANAARVRRVSPDGRTRIWS